jgi:hypothetical protein
MVTPTVEEYIEEEKDFTEIFTDKAQSDLFNELLLQKKNNPSLAKP